MINLLISLFISTANAQLVMWAQPPEEKTEIVNYSLGFEPFEDEAECKARDPKEDTKYYMDVGVAYQYDLRDSPMFLPGVTYYLSAYAFNEKYRSEKSPGFCFTMPSAEAPELEVVEEAIDVDPTSDNNTEQQTTNNKRRGYYAKTNHVDIGSKSNWIPVDSSSNVAVRMESRNEEHEGRGYYDRGFHSLRSRERRSTRRPVRNDYRARVQRSRQPESGDRRERVVASNKRPSLRGRENIQFSNYRLPDIERSEIRVSPVTRNFTVDTSQVPDGTDDPKSKSSIILWILVGLILGGAFVYYADKKKT